MYYYADRERETGLYLTHSPYVYGAALSRAGDVEGVERFLRLSDRNFVGPFDIPRESNYGGSVVVTGAGSFLSLMLYGVAGLENMGPCLASHACVPPSLGHLKISGIHFQGRRYSLSAEAATRGNAAAAALLKEMEPRPETHGWAKTGDPLPANWPCHSDLFTENAVCAAAVGTNALWYGHDVCGGPKARADACGTDNWSCYESEYAEPEKPVGYWASRLDRARPAPGSGCR